MKWLKLYLIVLPVLFTACKNDAGEGGKASVQGDVFVKEYDILGELTNEYPAEEERVYIIYGDDSSKFYDDWVRTSYDGSFLFDYLYEGDYHVFTYTNCDTCASGKQALMQSITISDKDEVVVLPSFEIN